LTADDIPAAMTLKNELGWNQTPEDWARFLRLAPAGAYKLTVDGGLAGTAVAFVFEEVCWIGMVIVKAAYRGRGHGNVLMQRCLEHAASRRCTLVQLDATNDGVSLYARLGFKPDYLVGTCRGRIVPPLDGEAAGKPAPMEISPVAATDLPELAALEAEALGANRQALLEELVARSAGGAAAGGEVLTGGGMACRSASGALQGFLLYRPGHHSVQVGPLIARDEDTAARVLAATLQAICRQAPHCEVTLTVPLYNRAMLEQLRCWGLPVTPRLTRMFRGHKRLQAREDMVYALSGPEKG
jgi:predicted GNAT family N-acyltransferase